MIDYKQIEIAADGRWFEILDYYGIETRKPMKLGPCPLCGGNDRAHFKPDGALYCRKCPDKELHFPNEVLQMVQGWDFPTFCREMGDYLGIDDKSEPVKRYRPMCSLTSAQIREANEKYEQVKDDKRYVPFFHDLQLVTLQYVYDSGKTKWMHDRRPTWEARHGVGSGESILCDHYEDYLSVRKIAKDYRIEYSAGRSSETVINERILGKECYVFVNPGDLLSLNDAVCVGASAATIVNGGISIISNEKAKKAIINHKAVDKALHVWEDGFNYSDLCGRQ